MSNRNHFDERSSKKHERKRRRHYSSDSFDEDDDDRNAGFYDFSRHKSKLNKIFFRDEDLVKQNSKEYGEFWQFLSKYQTIERRKAEKSEGKNKRSRRDVSDNLRVPNVAKPEHSLNFKLKPSKTKDLMNRIPFQDRDYDRDYLSSSMVEQFRKILGIYINFLQKEKFSKLRKLRASQASLPIADYREEIISQIRDNQVVIVAGDTGDDGSWCLNINIHFTSCQVVARVPRFLSIFWMQATPT